MVNLLGIFTSFSSALKSITIIIAVGLVIYACIKYQNGRIFVFSACGVALVVFSVYAGGYLNNYYNASGGIYGKIVGTFKTNQVELVDDLTFSINNISLTLDYEDHYSAEITMTKVVDLDADNEEFAIYVNGVPCAECDVQEDYAIAYYEYVFYDDDLTTILMQDTLTLKFAFYSNSTMLTISTDGGAEACKYWNYYFNKNVFKVTINNKGFVEQGYVYSIVFEVTATAIGDVGEGWIYTVSEDGLYTFIKYCEFGTPIGSLPLKYYRNGSLYSVSVYYYNNDFFSGRYTVTEDTLMPAYDIKLQSYSIGIVDEIITY